MNLRLMLRNLCAAFFSQGIALLCSVITTLVVPKVMGVEDFGYWQYFIFLVSYVSFFQLGINDGVYLIHGGEKRCEINKGLIRQEFILSTSLQSLFMFLIITLATMFALGTDKYVLFVAAAIYMVVSNATFFIGYVFQAMNETRLFSLSIVIDRLIFLIPLTFCLIFRIADCLVFILFFILARIFALGFCIYSARDFFRASSVDFSVAARALVNDAKYGIVLTFANVCGMLILGVARFLVEMKWGIEAFGQLSLSLSLVNFLMMFVSQLSMVLFPALRQVDKTEHPVLYRSIRDRAYILLPLMFLGYYPLVIFISCWLPQYKTGLNYFIYLMPILLYESLADMVCSTFFKVRCEPIKILFVNLSSLACALLGCLVSAALFDSINYVMAASILALAIRAYVGDYLLSRSYSSSNYRLMVTSAIFVCSFVLVNVSFGFGLGLLLSCVLLAVYICTNKREFLDLCSTVRVILKR